MWVGSGDTQSSRLAHLRLTKFEIGEKENYINNYSFMPG